MNIKQNAQNAANHNHTGNPPAGLTPQEEAKWKQYFAQQQAHNNKTS